MQAKTDKIEFGLIIITAIACYFHLQGQRLGSQVMVFMGASVVLYYVMRGALFFRAWPRAKGFALAGFGLFAWCAFLFIFVLSLFLNIPDIENKLPLLVYSAPIPLLALFYLITKHEQNDWLPFVFRLLTGLVVLFLTRFLLG
ncbi:MAG: hypothetical protein R3B47_21415 [Bacteroidia bacterium]